jgi:signal transduction histidine kinase
MSKKQKNDTRARKKRRIRLGVGWYISLIVIAELAAVLGLATGISYFLTEHFPTLANLPMTAWVVIVGIIIGAPISIFVNRALLSPIRKLGDAMNLVSKGSFGIQIHTRAPFGDIRDIYHNFNLMTRELAATEILKTDFVSNVSHEIKTPITAIEGYAMLLQGSETLSEEDSEYVDKILTNTQRLSELVGNVLLLSKIDNQAIETKAERFSLDEQIRQSILLLEPKWCEKNIELYVDLEHVIYEGNRGLMIHVWNNLIGNAIKFTPTDSTVKIMLSKGENNLVFEVEDQGSGIADMAINHIFDKFYQADSSHKQEGNGLGLSLAKRIIDIEGGQIKAENIEGGCRFTVILPEK